MSRMPLSGVMGDYADMDDAPYVDKYGGAVVGSVMTDDGQLSTSMDTGDPHITLAGLVLLTIGLVAFSHKNVGSLTSIKLTFADILSIGFVAWTFNVLLKVGTAKALAAGVPLPPGWADTAALA